MSIMRMKLTACGTVTHSKKRRRLHAAAFRSVMPAGGA